MPKYYAYIPRDDGTEPIGSENKTMFELKTNAGAIRRCKRYFGNKRFRLHTYTNFYDDITFRLVHEQKISINILKK